MKTAKSPACTMKDSSPFEVGAQLTAAGRGKRVRGAGLFLNPVRVSASSSAKMNNLAMMPGESRQSPESPFLARRGRAGEPGPRGLKITSRKRSGFFEK